MDHLEGEDLAARLKRSGPLPWDVASTIFEEAAAALNAAHQAGVLHRDLKPGNIFLAKSPSAPERVVLLDFGLAKREATIEPFLTQEGSLTIDGHLLLLL